MKNLQKIKRVFAASVIGFSMLLLPGASAQTYTLEQTVAGGGMSNAAGGVYSLSSTTGQTAAGNALGDASRTMTVGFWNYAALAPTAASASISGRVATANGRGIRNAQLVLTDSSGATRYAQTAAFGYFRFSDVPVGGIYVLTVYAKRFVFAQPSRVLNLTEDLTDVTFTSEN